MTISQLMATITQANEWFRICNEDPQIQRASALVPEDIMGELWGALCNLEEAQESSAILYGIRVAGAIRDVAARPADLSHYVIDRAAQRRMGQNG